MSHFIPWCAGCVVFATGAVALAFPAHIADLAEQCHAVVTRTNTDRAPDANARRFDEIVAQIKSIDELPRPVMKSAPSTYMPHFSVSTTTAKKPDWTNHFASSRTRTSNNLLNRRSASSQPQGMYARSRVGRRSNTTKSIFEQSRAYKRHGSAFEGLRSSGRYRR